MTVTNNGHTGKGTQKQNNCYFRVFIVGVAVLFSLPSGIPAESIPYITGGGLSNRYNFVQFHFHWGNDSSHGSDHLIKYKK